MDFMTSIPEKLKIIVRKAELKSPQEIICVSKTTLLKYGGSPDDIDLLKSIAAKSICPPFKSVYDLLANHSSNWKRFFFCCNSIDSCTGGIWTRGITEICGESGAGKTQLLLQLSLRVQLPEKYGGLEKGAAFICTEDAFPSKRLYELVHHIKTSHPDVKDNFLENIFLEHILDNENLQKCVSTRLPALMETQNIGLIVIDSVAAIYRIESNIISRANEMRNLANALLSLSEKHYCAVICVNQVSACLYDSNLQIPSLGLAWESLVRTRLKISKTGTNVISKTLCQSVPLRKLEVMYSPVVPRRTCEFLITAEGAIDFED